MCNIHDAERYEKIAELQIKDKEYAEAHTSYLEAASIYILQAQLLQNDSLVKKANGCYKRSKEVLGEMWDKELTKQELAKRTLAELDHNHHSHELRGV